jgi:hypothetical protein
MKKSAKFFGKSLLALALGIIAVAGLAVAGLLSYYGQFTGKATVQQSVQVSLDGRNWKECKPVTSGGYECDLEFSVNPTAGDPVTQTVYVKNTANANANVKLDTICPSDFHYNNEVTLGEKVECYADADKTKLGVTIEYAVKDKDNNLVDPDNGVYTLSQASSPYSLEIKYTFAINAEPKEYDIVTQIIPA